MSPTLVIVQPKLPAYRWSFFERIASDWPGRVLLIYGEDQTEGPLSSLANDRRPSTFDRLTVPWTRCLNRWFLAVRPLLVAVLAAQPAVLVLPGDINQPGVHLLMLLARFHLRIPAVCVGQYRRSSAHRLVTSIKPLWHRAFSGLVLYNQREYAIYRERFNYPAERLTYLNNGLDRVPAAPDPAQLAGRRATGPFVCLGRLERKNRFDLAIAAHARYRAAGGQRALELIGDGEEGPALRAAAAGDGSVRFLGPVYAEEELDALLGGAYALIHPYGVGLSLNQAFGHGCPVICCGDPERQMPEFWIWQDGVNGFGFAHHDDDRVVVGRLAEVLLGGERLPAAAYAACCRHAHQAVMGMTTENMAARTLGLLRQVSAGSPGGAPPQPQAC